MATEDQGVEVVAAKVSKAKQPKQQLKGDSEKASKPAAAKARPAPKRNHPTYLQMVSEAISSMKERSGSSQPAIAKYLEDKYQSELPANFKRILSIQLRNMSNSGKLTKVKNSFKLSSGRTKPAAAAAAKPKSEAGSKATAAPKPKKVKKTASKATIAASNSKAKASSTEARDLRAASRSKAKQADFLPSTLTTKKRKPAISALNSPKRAKRLTK